MMTTIKRIIQKIKKNPRDRTVQEVIADNLNNKKFRDLLIQERQRMLEEADKDDLRFNFDWDR